MSSVLVCYTILSSDWFPCCFCCTCYYDEYYYFLSGAFQLDTNTVHTCVCAGFVNEVQTETWTKIETEKQDKRMTTSKASKVGIGRCLVSLRLNATRKLTARAKLWAKVSHVNENIRTGYTHASRKRWTGKKEEEEGRIKEQAKMRNVEWDKAKCIDRIINLKMTQKPSEPKLWATNAQTEIVTTRICCLVLFASSLIERESESTAAAASDSCLQHTRTN